MGCFGTGMQQGWPPRSPDCYPLCLFSSCFRGPCRRTAGPSAVPGPTCTRIQRSSWTSGPHSTQCGWASPPITCSASGTCCSSFILKNPKIKEGHQSISRKHCGHLWCIGPCRLLCCSAELKQETERRGGGFQSHRLHVNSRRSVFQSVQTNMACTLVLRLK